MIKQHCRQTVMQVGRKKAYVPPMIKVVRLGLTKDVTVDSSGLISASGTVSGFNYDEKNNDLFETEDDNNPKKPSKKVW